MKRRGFLRTVLGLAAAVFSPLAAVGGKPAAWLIPSSWLEPTRKLMADGRSFTRWRIIHVSEDMATARYLSGDLAPLIDMETMRPVRYLRLPRQASRATLRKFQSVLGQELS